MSGGRISAADGGLAAALAAGWRAGEWEWEAAQEQAVLLAADGAPAAAARFWKAALALARENFSADDLRLGTSLANVGFFLAREGRRGGAYLRPAAAIWELSPMWIDRVVIEARGRSSVHHFRMANKNRVAYQTRARRLLQESAARARGIVGGRITGGAGEQLAQWRRDKPAGFDDERKILSACLLLVSA